MNKSQKISRDAGKRGAALERTAHKNALKTIESEDTKSLEFATDEFEKNTNKTRKKTKLDACPLWVLPDNIRILIEELQEKYKLPSEFSLMYLLFAVSLAIGNNFRVKVKKSWVEPAVLYLAVVALAGQAKTPVQNFFMAIFKKWDKKNFEDFAEALKRHLEKKQSATKENPLTEDPPKRTQYLLQDYTPESAIKALADNWHGLGVMFDELAGFFGNMNRYNGGNEIPMWLSFYNAQSHSTNRKTSQDSYLAHPFASVIGGIQPGVLSKIFPTLMQSNGMLDRFLLVYPVELKKEIPTEDELDQDYVDAYENMIECLLSIKPDKDEKDNPRPREIEFTPESKKRLFVYFQINADLVNEMNEKGKERLASMYSKYDYHVIRLSFILQVMHDACLGRYPKYIGLEAVNGGIELADYFKIHSKRIHELLTGDPLAKYTEEKKKFFNELPNTKFHLSEALKLGAKSRSGEPDTIEKWVKRFLGTDELFTHLDRGFYQKKPL